MYTISTEGIVETGERVVFTFIDIFDYHGC